ncbi:MAG: FAD-binding domain-containing protein, partial [Pseudomonadota bacterium]
MGAGLVLRQGDICTVLSDLYSHVGPFDLWSHQETGTAWTFARDQAVAAWCAEHKVTWHQPMTFGVWRGAALNRDRWAARWDSLMAQAQLSPPPARWVHAPSEALTDPMPLDSGHQVARRATALADLESFLHVRGQSYRRAMSSPLEGAQACSRLSVPLAYGVISMREVLQTAHARLMALEEMPPGPRRAWRGSISSFIARLHWHCHFIQKLEAEPEIEWRPMARVYEGVRSLDGREPLLEAFEAGRTGYPFVDACLRSLKTTGWINFRMRAMLMSFASYDLFLPWQDAGRILARWFTDFEPGIHWSQCQMQSGETGINTIRVYSPIKQGLDQDPNGVFTRTWVPELAHLEGAAIHTPWTEGGVPGYPEPVVDHKEAVREAKAKLFAIRRTDAARSEADQVQKKHGSRKR